MDKIVVLEQMCQVIGLAKMPQARSTQKDAGVGPLDPPVDEIHLVACDQGVGLAHGGVGLVGIAAFGQGHEFVNLDHDAVGTGQRVALVQARMQGQVAARGGRVGPQKTAGLSKTIAMSGLRNGA